MKKHFIRLAVTAVLLTLALPTVAGAQTVFRGGKLYADGVLLTKENAAAQLPAPFAEKYTRALATEKVGSIIAYTGGGVALVSGAVWAISDAVRRNRDTCDVPAGWGLGIEGMVIGAAITAGGLVTYLVGRNQVRLIGERSSASSQIELDLGFTPSGLGLALNF